MAEILAFAIIVIGPIIFLLLHGRSLLKRGRGGKLSQRGRIEIFIGLGLLAILLPPFIIGLSGEIRRMYQLNTSLFLTLVIPATVLLIILALHKAKILDVSLYGKELLSKFKGKSQKAERSDNKVPSNPSVALQKSV